MKNGIGKYTTLGVALFSAAVILAGAYLLDGTAAEMSLYIGCAIYFGLIALIGCTRRSKDSGNL